MKIILASNNKNKIKEIKSILSNIEILTLEDIGYKDDIEETGTTFEENALIKAKTIYDIYHIPVISDDSGLCVKALNNAPGVYSHRYAGDDLDDNANNLKLINNLKNEEDRSAFYMCAICYYDGSSHFFIGKCEGIIIDESRGTNGFGYDPYFYIEKFDKTMAELSMEEKNTISHRAKALEKLKEESYELFNN